MNNGIYHVRTALYLSSEESLPQGKPPADTNIDWSVLLGSSNRIRPFGLPPSRIQKTERLLSVHEYRQGYCLLVISTVTPRKWSRSTYRSHDRLTDHKADSSVTANESKGSADIVTSQKGSRRKEAY